MSYGRDQYTTRLQQIIKSEFGASAEAFPVFNGTGANVVALQSMQPTSGGVICAHTAHINTDEGGAPERVAGLKMLPARTDDGKLTCAHIAQLAHNFGDVHHAQPSVVSITQSTELGTNLHTRTRSPTISASGTPPNEMAVHLDGARLANAAAALSLPLRAVDHRRRCGCHLTRRNEERIAVRRTPSWSSTPARSAGNQLHPRSTRCSWHPRCGSSPRSSIALFEGGLWLDGALHANAQGGAATQARSEDIPRLDPLPSRHKPTPSSRSFRRRSRRRYAGSPTSRRGIPPQVRCAGCAHTRPARPRCTASLRPCVRSRPPRSIHWTSDRAIKPRRAVSDCVRSRSRPISTPANYRHGLTRVDGRRCETISTGQPRSIVVVKQPKFSLCPIGKSCRSDLGLRKFQRRLRGFDRRTLTALGVGCTDPLPGRRVVADQAHALNAVDAAFGGFVDVPALELTLGPGPVRVEPRHDDRGVGSLTATALGTRQRAVDGGGAAKSPVHLAVGDDPQERTTPKASGNSVCAAGEARRRTHRGTASGCLDVRVGRFWACVEWPPLGESGSAVGRFDCGNDCRGYQAVLTHPSTPFYRPPM